MSSHALSALLSLVEPAHRELARAVRTRAQELEALQPLFRDGERCPDEAEWLALHTDAIVHDSWEELEAQLIRLGKRAADLGVPMAAWPVLVGACREAVAERGPSLEAMLGFGQLADWTLSTLSGAYRAQLQQRTERANARNRLLAQIVDSLDEAVLSKTLDGVVRSWNPGAEAMYGYTEAEAVGKHISELHVPEERREEVDELLDRLRQGARVERLETVRIRRDGSRLPVQLTLTPIRDRSGKPVGAAAIARDLTAFQAVLAQANERAAALRRSNRDLEQFAYAASHDLLEPLRMTASFTELLAERYADRLDERGRQYLAFAHDGARRMQRLVGDLLAFSRIESDGGPLEPVDPQAALADALAAHPELDAATVSIHPLPAVRADREQLVRLLYNLLDNCWKFRSESPLHIAITAQEEGEQVRIAIRDNGIGVPEADSGRVFDLFKRLHAREAYPGSGIGLTIAKRIVERHGGSIGLEAAEGGGTRVFFTLGAADAP